MSEFTYDDVEMMLTRSAELDRMQREVREFVSALLPTLEQMFLSWDVPTDDMVLDVRLVEKPIPVNFVFRRDHSGVHRTKSFVRIDVYFGAIRHEYIDWRGNCKPLPSVFVPDIRSNLAAILNVASARTTAIRDHVEFLRDLKVV